MFYINIQEQGRIWGVGVGKGHSLIFRRVSFLEVFQHSPHFFFRILITFGSFFQKAYLTTVYSSFGGRMPVQNEKKKFGQN